jgi:hypothetical protein
LGGYSEMEQGIFRIYRKKNDLKIIIADKERR